MHAHNGFVYLEMRRVVCGLPQAGILANKLLRRRLLPHGYYECTYTPGLWKHKWRLISFTLVVDDFGVKYVGKAHVEHLIRCIKEKYEVTEDWTGDLYCGITLKRNYDKRWLDISMPGYIKKLLLKYNIAFQLNLNIVRTPLPPNSTEQKHKHPYLLIFLPNCLPKKSRKSSVS